MKKIVLFLILVVILVILAVYFSRVRTTTPTGNRIATHDDVLKYGDFITEGDLIFDTPTKTFTDGINQLRYTSISKTFPNIREDAKLWIDGERIGPLCEVRFLNGNETTPWNISSATLKPIPGTRINTIYTHNSYGGFLWLIQGLKNLVIDGENDAYPGLSQWPKERKFIRGTFGISVTSAGIYDGFHGLSISVLNGGSFSIKGVEAEHGFSALRFQGGSYDWILSSVEITRCYFHDTESENTYIGATHSPPLAKINNLKFHDCILSRSGSEAIQLQHITGESFIYNITSFATDAAYLANFQPNQDTGSQWNVDSGTTTISNIFMDTWGSHGANFFGGNSDTVDCDSKCIMKNVAFNDGRAEAIYFHNSMKYGMKWIFDSIYIRKSNNDWYIHNKTKPTDWLISTNNGTDSIYFYNVFHDGSKPNVFQNTSKIHVEKDPILVDEIPQVGYVNSGFYEPSNKIKFWRHYYAAYLSGNDTTAVQVDAGDIMIDRETDHQPVFCKALVSHRATAIRPKNDPAHYKILTWDEEGDRNDQPLWDSADVQLQYPPDDLRIKADNFWGKLNIGYVQDVPTCEELEAQIRMLKNEIAKRDGIIHELRNKLYPWWAFALLFLQMVIIILLLKNRKIHW